MAWEQNSLYHSADPTIAAIGPARYAEWPCGTQLRVCSRVGDIGQAYADLGMVPSLRCLIVIRQDSCPGCGPNAIDLSEAGLAAICPGDDWCPVTIQVLWRP